MKISAVIWCVAIVLVQVAIVSSRATNEKRKTIREKRTIQYLVNHFAQFFRLSNPGKSHEKQDIAVNPLKHLLMASSAQFSGGSGSKKPSTTPKPFGGQFEIPSLPERLVQAEPVPTSGPDRIGLLESTSSTEASTEAPVTEATSTTTEAPASSEEPTTEAPTTNSPSTEEPASEPEQTTVDPTAINGLVNNDAESRDDNSTQIDNGSIQSTSNFVSQQQQYRQPVWNPFPSNAFSQLPYTTYFGNNVFLPAPFIPQPFSHFGYQHRQPAAANLITAASSSSHSRVKMHDHPYDLVTYHGDSVSSPSSYQMQVFGKRPPLY